MPLRSKLSLEALPMDLSSGNRGVLLGLVGLFSTVQRSGMGGCSSPNTSFTDDAEMALIPP